MIRIATLRMDILSYWRCGTGEGRSAMLDETCLRDKHGLPFVPGRHLKGLLREAVRQLGEFGAEKFEGEAVSLFGEIGFRRGPNQAPIPRRRTKPGLLGVESARLAQGDAAYFASNADARAELFRVVRSTAIDRMTRTARETSLRQEEVTIPLTLFAGIDLLGQPGEGGQEAILDCLDQATMMFRSVGAKRNRALGRCIVTLEAA